MVRIGAVLMVDGGVEVLRRLEEWPPSENPFPAKFAFALFAAVLETGPTD